MPGSTAKIKWNLDDVNTVAFRGWAFKRGDGSLKNGLPVFLVIENLLLIQIVVYLE